MTENLCLLGSTGSIGTQTLSLVSKLGINVSAISAHSNIDLLERQALEFKPAHVCVVDENAAKLLKIALAPTSIKVLAGAEGLCEIASLPGCDTVLNSVVGIAGLSPTLAAIDAGKDIALANKETLVAAGRIVTERCREKGVKLLPVDSEHSAIFQCLQDPHSAKTLKRIFLTASGGPFFGYNRAQLAAVKKEDALKHPTWKMGRKITIDSATLMNKGLEVIEAMWLFGLGVEDIVVTVHRQSIVHSMVEFADNSVLAQLGLPDMRLPIQYALTYPERLPSPESPLNIAALGELTFADADEQTFACLGACKRAAETGGLAPCVANAANEAAVALFLDDRISFLDIGAVVGAAVDSAPKATDYTLADVLAADADTRAAVAARYN